MRWRASEFWPQKLYTRGEPLGRWKTIEFLWILPFWYLYFLHILRSIYCTSSRLPLGATNMRVPGRNIYMSVGSAPTTLYVLIFLYVGYQEHSIQKSANRCIHGCIMAWFMPQWSIEASGPCIVVPAYLFIQACSFLRLWKVIGVLVLTCTGLGAQD